VVVPGAWTSVITSLTDKAINIQNNLDALANYPTLLATLPINLRDSLPATITANTTQVVSDAAVFKNIQNSYLLSIKDTASTINGLDFSKLTSKYIELTPTLLDATLNISATVADINLTQAGLSATAVISKADYNVTGTDVSITDNGVTRHLYLANTPKDNLAIYAPVDLSLPAQNITIAASELAANLHYYENLAKAGKLGNVLISDAKALTSTQSIAQLVQYADVFKSLSWLSNFSDLATNYANANITAITVQDSASVVQSNIDTLQADLSKLYAIQLTDNAAPTLNLSTTQYANDSGALSKITSSFTADITDTATNTAKTVSAIDHFSVTFSATPQTLDFAATTHTLLHYASSSNDVLKVTHLQKSTDQIIFTDLGNSDTLQTSDTLLSGQQAVFVHSSADSLHGVVIVGVHGADLHIAGNTITLV
jgi:hypothetical protein